MTNQGVKQQGPIYIKQSRKLIIDGTPFSCEKCGKSFPGGTPKFGDLVPLDEAVKKEMWVCQDCHEALEAAA